MVQFRKVQIQTDTRREFEAFGNSPVQRVLHNDFLRGLEVEREKLELAATHEEFLRQQGVVRALRDTLNLLHSRDTGPVLAEFTL